MEEEGSVKSSQPEKEDNSSSPMWDFMKDKLEALFVLIVPYDPIKEYPKRFLFGLGSVLVFLVFAFFAGLFYYLFETNKGTVFLSPRNGVDNTAICESVPATNTGLFLATRDGLWGGAKGFVYSNAFLFVSAVNLEISEMEYSKLLKSLGQKLKEIGKIMENSDLTVNLMYWFSFSALYDPLNTANRVSLIGDPSIALNRHYIFGTVASAQGVCFYTDAPASLDSTSSILTYSIPYYMYNYDCTNIGGPPSNLGASPFSSAAFFDLKFDIRSLMTALAVNYGVLNFEYLIEIPALRQEVLSLNLTFREMFDPKFPGMSPIQCLTEKACAIRVGANNFGVPFFHQ
jgi:hypothetical protein